MATQRRKSKKTAKIHPISFDWMIRLVLSIFILIMLLAQLFTFENFPGLLVGVGVAPVVSLLLGSLLVVAELAALPYLLKMSASSNVIRVSKVCGFIILAALSVLEGMAAVNNTTSTLFGATANLPGGLWALFLLSALWILLLRVNLIDKNSVKPGANSRKNKRKRPASS